MKGTAAWPGKRLESADNTSMPQRISWIQTYPASFKFIT